MNKTNKEMEFSKYIFPKIKTKKWKKIRLIDTTNKKIKWSFTGGPFGSNLQSSDYTNDGIRVIQLQNIGDGVFNNDYKIYTSEEKANELLSCNIYPNEILISKMGDPVGRACIVPEQEKRYVMCSDGIRIVVDEDKYSKDYIYYAINSEAFRLKIFKNSTGSTRRRIGLDILKNLEMLILKEKEEQEKIANCLKSIDDLILQEEDKLEKLKSHKKGLLQKLFPKQNSQTPEWRFKEFNNCEIWDIIPLRKLAIYRRGSFPQPYGLPEWYDNIEGMPFIQVFDVDENLKLKAETKNKISKIAQQQSIYIPKGTIIVTIQGSIGRVAITDYDAYVDRTLLLFEKFYRKVDKNFIAYSLQLLFDIEKQKAPGGIIKTITKEVLSNFNISLPKYKEQQKIAECLSSIDNLISAQTRKTELLKQHKKGLLQGLFPSIEEVENE